MLPSNDIRQYTEVHYGNYTNNVEWSWWKATKHRPLPTYASAQPSQTHIHAGTIHTNTGRHVHTITHRQDTQHTHRHDTQHTHRHYTQHTHRHNTQHTHRHDTQHTHRHDTQHTHRHDTQHRWQCSMAESQTCWLTATECHYNYQPLTNSQYLTHVASTVYCVLKITRTRMWCRGGSTMTATPTNHDEWWPTWWNLSDNVKWA